MANGRGDRGKTGAGRDAGRFVAIPLQVLDSASYLGLSHRARSLLLEIARQFAGNNNGKLLASRAYLKQRGWNSADLIHRAKAELLDAGLIFETVKGHRPNKASWFALTWQSLDRHPGYDLGAEAGFERGAYRKGNAVLSPAGGTGRRTFGPAGGQGTASSVPSAGPVRLFPGRLAVPPDGHHLEQPSAEVDTQPERTDHSPGDRRSTNSDHADSPQIGKAGEEQSRAVVASLGSTLRGDRRSVLPEGRSRQ